MMDAAKMDMNGGINSGNVNLVSKIAKLASKTEAAIQKTVESFEKIQEG